MIGPRVGVGARHKWVKVEHAGPHVPNGDGGYVPSWVPGVPAIWQVSIVAASAAVLERAAVGTIVGTATHVLTGPYRADLAMTSRIIVDGRRVFEIVGLGNVEERGQELVAVCLEDVTATAPGGAAA